MITIDDIQAKEDTLLQTVVAVSTGVDTLLQQIADLKAGQVDQAKIDALSATADQIQIALDAVRTKEGA